MSLYEEPRNRATAITDCPDCRGIGKVYPEHLRGEIVAMDTIPGYDPRVPCETCDGSGAVDKYPDHDDPGGS